MRHLNKKLAIIATATALAGAIGASVAQSNDPTETDSQNAAQKVEVNGSGQQIYFFRDQGNSPETDPAAHLLLIKHQSEAVPVAETTTTTTTVAQNTTTNNDAVTTTMPAASDTSNTETSADTSTAAAPVDNQPALAPKADRN
ncbi:MAG TPA: hypothetical protein VIP05_35660 [Burkholderiaceae bacterium]